MSWDTLEAPAYIEKIRTDMGALRLRRSRQTEKAKHPDMGNLAQVALR